MDALQVINSGEHGSTFRPKINENSVAIVTAINLKADISALSSHIGELNKHRVCNDSSSPSDTILYSSSKINTLLGGKANTSHNHTASQISDGSTVFAPISHQHNISDIINIAGLNEIITSWTSNFTTDRLTSEYSSILVSDIIGVPTGHTQPPIFERTISLTWTASSKTLVQSFTMQDNEKLIPKPKNLWEGWESSSTAILTVAIRVINLVNGTYFQEEFSNISVSKYIANEITLTALKDSIKADSGMMQALASYLQ